MLIDCDACVARGPACGDCVVTVLLGAPPGRRQGGGDVGIDLDRDEQAAIAVLAGSGLVPPLRLRAVPDPSPADAGEAAPGRRSGPAAPDRIIERAGHRPGRRPGDDAGDAAVNG